MKQNDATYKRIESMVNIKLQADALLAFGAMMKDLLAEESWENEDIVKYMTIRMQEAADRWINPENDFLNRKKQMKSMKTYKVRINYYSNSNTNEIYCDDHSFIRLDEAEAFCDLLPHATKNQMITYGFHSSVENIESIEIFEVKTKMTKKKKIKKIA